MGLCLSICDIGVIMEEAGGWELGAGWVVVLRLTFYVLP